MLPQNPTTTTKRRIFTPLYRSAITTDNARLDIRARGFWFAAQDAYFDVRVFNPNAPSNSSRIIKAAYKKHEDENKRAYGQRVRDIEQGVFTPSSSQPQVDWGKSPEKTSRYARLEIRKKLFSIVISWLRCKLSFAAVRCKSVEQDNQN